MTGLCGCGCGQPTPLFRRTDRRVGHIKGQPMRYLHGHYNAGLAKVAALAAGPDATPVELYAAELLAAAELFVAAVHDEDLPARRARLYEALSVPAPDGTDPYEALATVLAAQVDPDAPRSARVGWTDRFTTPSRRAG